MAGKAAVSPFWRQREEADWILWDQSMDLLGLQENAAYSPAEVREQAPQPVQTRTMPTIQRPRYDSIVSKMNLAASSTGQFAAWQQ